MTVEPNAKKEIVAVVVVIEKTAVNEKNGLECPSSCRRGRPDDCVTAVPLFSCFPAQAWLWMY